MTGADDSLTVVKVGGSLYDLPDLKERLNTFLEGLQPGRILLVPGGGRSAEVIRHLDRVHRLGEEAAHWLALRILTGNAYFLHELLPRSEVVAHPAATSQERTGILDAFALASQDENSDDRLPHRWEVTSDAIAVRAAILGRARRLVLLKSVHLPEGFGWQQAAEAGMVDPLFPRLVPECLDLIWINFRTGDVKAAG